MKNTLKFLSLSTLILFTACSTPQMAIDQQLHTSTAMPVKGRQGWMVNQHLPFGEFTSGKVNRG